MSTQAHLAATIAYLRFPLRTDHRGGLRDGTQCPHCPGTRVQKWGGFAGRQRFRCRDCRRTFSTFTGSPLRYLKRPERWRAFLWCMEDRLTVRRSGAVVGVDKNTALRWRHRVLDRWREEPHRRLRGSVAVGEFWLPWNEKGSRHLLRRARRHGYAVGRWREHADRLYLIAAVETGGIGSAAVEAAGTGSTAVGPEGTGCADQWIGCPNLRQLGASDYAVMLDPRLGSVGELVGGRGPLCALAQYAASIGATYRPDDHGAASAGVVRSELMRWLRPFRGVASHRLSNYLEWFRRAVDPAHGRRTAFARANNSRRQRHRGARGSRGTRSVGRRVGAGESAPTKNPAGGDG